MVPDDVIHVPRRRGSKSIMNMNNKRNTKHMNLIIIERWWLTYQMMWNTCHKGGDLCQRSQWLLTNDPKWLGRKLSSHCIHSIGSIILSFNHPLFYDQMVRGLSQAEHTIGTHPRNTYSLALFPIYFIALSHFGFCKVYPFLLSEALTTFITYPTHNLSDTQPCIQSKSYVITYRPHILT